MSREIPIIFNGDMVRAILSGQKTQTRRPVKSDFIQSDRAPLEVAAGIFHFWCSGEHACPHGQPGDLLWVRETFSEAGGNAPELMLYRANYPSHVISDSRGYENIPPASAIKWRPSIHMPRWASRILLRVTAVRVERVQGISEQDAWAEGCEGWDDDVTGGLSGFDEFAELWDRIYGSWADNPWVWVIEFERVTDSKREAA